MRGFMGPTDKKEHRKKCRKGEGETYKGKRGLAKKLRLWTSHGKPSEKRPKAEWPEQGGSASL